MTRRSTELTDSLYAYLLATSLREPPILARLREETAKLPMANMQIGPEQGQFMRLLVELIGARRTIEVGTFTGYSALSVAMARNAWDLNRTQEDWPNIRFLTTRERA